MRVGTRLGRPLPPDDVLGLSDEVRTLARRTQDSASEIDSMIAQLQAAADDQSHLSRQISDLAERIRELSDLSNQDAGALNSMSQNSIKLAQRLQDISR